MMKLLIDQQRTYSQKGEVVAQDAAQRRGCGHVDLGELHWRHLPLCALTEIDGTE